MIDDVERPKLQDTPDGRSWELMLSNDEEHVHPIKAAIIPLVTFDYRDHLNILGTAFIIAANGSRALCMCAAHSLEEVNRLANARRPQSMWSIPPDLVKPSVNSYMFADRIMAWVDLDKEVVICEVKQLHYIAANDIALITITNPKRRDIFDSAFALDFAVPAIGTVVAVCGNNIMENTQTEDGGRVGVRFEIRRGIVVDARFEKTMGGQSCVFYTTIPVPPGMSGSPVLIWPHSESKATVCGVVSSDLSSDAATESFLVPGRSAISMLWPSYGLGVTGQREETFLPEHFSIAELVRLGFVRDRTTAAQVTLERQDTKSTLISYLVERTRRKSPAAPRAAIGQTTETKRFSRRMRGIG